MQPKTDTDVLIVGGGPAGLLTALALAKQGLRSKVFDRRAWPVDKACGEGLMPNGLDVFSWLGLDQDLAEAQSYDFKGIRFWTPKGSVQGAFPGKQTGKGLKRTELSRMLYEACIRNHLIQLWEEHRVISVETNKNQSQIIYRHKSKQGVASGHWLVIADGLHSSVCKYLNLKSRKLPWGRMGCRQHFNIRPWCNHVQVFWQNGFEVYVTPVGDQEAEVAILADSASWAKHFHRDTLDSWISDIPELKNRLTGVSPSGGLRAYGPLGVLRSQPDCQRPVVLVGDSYCFWDGITGEGISMAALQARAVARSFMEMGRADWKSDSPKRRCLISLLHIELRTLLIPYLIMTGIAMFLARFSGFRAIVFASLFRFPRLLDRLLAWNVGIGWPEKLARGYRFFHQMIYLIKLKRLKINQVAPYLKIRTASETKKH